MACVTGEPTAHNSRPQQVCLGRACQVRAGQTVGHHARPGCKQTNWRPRRLTLESPVSRGRATRWSPQESSRPSLGLVLVLVLVLARRQQPAIVASRSRLELVHSRPTRTLVRATPSARCLLLRNSGSIHIVAAFRVCKSRNCCPPLACWLPTGDRASACPAVRLS